MGLARLHVNALEILVEFGFVVLCLIRIILNENVIGDKTVQYQAKLIVKRKLIFQHFVRENGHLLFVFNEQIASEGFVQQQYLLVLPHVILVLHPEHRPVKVESVLHDGSSVPLNGLVCLVCEDKFVKLHYFSHLFRSSRVTVYGHTVICHRQYKAIGDWAKGVHE